MFCVKALLDNIYSLCFPCCLEVGLGTGREAGWGGVGGVHFFLFFFSLNISLYASATWEPQDLELKF